MKESKILVLLVEPGKCPKIVQIEDALVLRALFLYCFLVDFLF